MRFQLTIADGLTVLARRADARPSAVQLDLPFISVLVHPTASDRALARELLARMGDRRVLNASECCDNCIDLALKSLQEIRGFLLDLQVKLSNADDSVLAPLVTLMAGPIRQFLTFEQTLIDTDGPVDGRDRPWAVKEAYFGALEVLRGHISRCLGQVATIAGVDAPSDGLIPAYRGPWPLADYIDPGSTMALRGQT